MAPRARTARRSSRWDRRPRPGRRWTGWKWRARSSCGWNSNLHGSSPARRSWARWDADVGISKEVILAALAQHLGLTAIALLLAVLIGVPLGVHLARQKFLARPVLALI